jgi:beta-carotene hydroxylase
VLAVVFAPAWLASGLLALVFDWLPHHPHAVQGRFVDTRVFPSLGLEMLMLGQNLHLVHHLWPSVPFYRYGAVFAACRDALAEKAADAGREPVVGPLDPMTGDSAVARRGG